MPKNYRCHACNGLKLFHELKFVKSSEALANLKLKYPDVTDTSKVCSKCRTLAFKIVKPSVQTSPRVEPQDRISTGERASTSHENCEESEEKRKVVVRVGRAVHSHKICVVCNKKVDSLKNIPVEGRCRFLVDNGFLIPKGARCCPKHLNGDVLKPDVLILPHTEESLLDSDEIKELFDGLRKIGARRGLDFDTPGVLKEDDYWRLTGVHIRDFNTILEIIQHGLRTSSNRSTRTSLAIFLMKLRTGLSHHVLSTLFAVPRDVIRRSIHSVREAMMEKFVPLYLGYDHLTREEVEEKHTRPLAKELFGTDGGDIVIVVADGTYIYIQKSSNYQFQRRSFSMHKGRPLVKPMMIVTTTGYILEVLGPFYADGQNNDAAIITAHMNAAAENLKSWLREKDVIVVDRGFRDSVEMLEGLDLIVKMPHFLPKNQKQHTPTEANESRLVTSIRWVVEASNGLIKTFKALENTMPNSQVPYIGDYVRIVAAICNAFRPPRILEDESAAIIGQRMLSLSKQRNDLAEKVEDENWSRKTVIWEKIDENAVTDFPRLTFEELKELTLGVYQLKQASSYTTEHFNDDGMYELYSYKESADILRVKIQSWHTSSKIYSLWIQYHRTGVLGWYCQCKVGARTVGCCAHIASVIWYLAYQRHQEDQDHEKTSSTFSSYLEDAGGGWTDDEE